MIEKLREALKGKPNSSYVLLGAVAIFIELFITIILSIISGLFIFFGGFMIIATVVYLCVLADENNITRR